MPSLIDASKPQDGSSYLKSDLRGSLRNAKDEIEVLQKNAGHMITPQTFSPEGYIGQAQARPLSADFSTIADALVQYPLMGDEITANGNLANITHDWAAIKQALKTAQTNPGVSIVHLPAGDYALSDTLKVTDGGGGTVTTAYLRGEGQGYGPQLKGTLLTATAIPDRPAVSVQGGRNVTIENLSIIAGNTATDTQTDSTLSEDLSDWISPGYASGRYSPQCGIAIDPYTTDPGGGLGYTNDPYGRTKTSAALIDNVGIWKCVVGVAVSVSDDGQNADNVIMSRCFLQRNAIALSSGGSQNRTLVFRDGYIYGSHTCSSTVDFGRQSGNCFQIDNSTALLFHNFIRWGASDPASITNCFLENFVRLGYYNGGPIHIPLTWKNCHMKWVPGLLGRQKPSEIFEVGDRATSFFTGCRFEDGSGSNVFNLVCASRGKIVVDGGSYFYSPGSLTRIVPGHSSQGRAPTYFEDCSIVTTNLPIAQRLLSRRQAYGASGGSVAMPDRVEALPTTETATADGKVYRYSPGNYSQDIAVPGLSAVGLTASALTFNTTEPEIFFVDDPISTNITNSNRITFLPRITALVNSIVGNTVTCDLLCDQDQIGDVPTTVRLVQSREFAPKTSPEATCSTASADITFASDISGIFNEGDWIQGDTGTWTNYRVLTISGDGLTITLNKNAPFTGTTAMFWGRLYEIVGTAQ